MKRWVLAIGVSLATMMGCAGPATTPPDSSGAERSEAKLGSLAVGQPCPPFSFDRLAGPKVDLASFKGKSLVVMVSSYT